MQVSWLRHRGNTIDLLTVGDTKYSGDERINVSIVYDNIFLLIYLFNLLTTEFMMRNTKLYMQVSKQLETHYRKCEKR